MNFVQRTLFLPYEVNKANYGIIIEKEWLLTNGLGGYASTALIGATTRKYHGLLVAGLPPPLGRVIFLNYLQESILIEGQEFLLSHEETLENSQDRHSPLLEFKNENGLPVWTYTIGSITIEKRIVMPYLQNSAYFVYKVLECDKPFTFRFNPFYKFRHHESPVSSSLQEAAPYKIFKGYWEMELSHLPSLKIIADQKNVKLIAQASTLNNVLYRIEEERGYESVSNLSSPGYFESTLEAGATLSFVATCESAEKVALTSSEEVLKNENKRRIDLLEEAKQSNPHVNFSKFALELVLAADQFIISDPVNTESKTIIAGYHWFTDWGRDAMISLEGLTMVTGRFRDAKCILRNFSNHIRRGLIPNMFPDKENEGIYNTADATLWFFHALERYLSYTQDECFISEMLPKLKEILREHIKGTDFGIHVDASDGLLVQGEVDYALTWMDAKAEKLVITPRRGKAIEINALWYNALNTTLEWIKKFENVDDMEFIKWSTRCYESFNKKFWIQDRKYLYDVIEGPSGNDKAIRPNQIIALSLKYPVLDPKYWEDIIRIIQRKLLTPVGLRTLSMDHPDYRVSYKGNLFLRDSAYHQGTIWPWLLGPFIDAWLKVYPEEIEEAKSFLNEMPSHLSDGCIGSINEIFDADLPYYHRGCISQAWSVSEVLRCWIKTHK